MPIFLRLPETKFDMFKGQSGIEVDPSYRNVDVCQKRRIELGNDARTFSVSGKHCLLYEVCSGFEYNAGKYRLLALVNKKIVLTVDLNAQKAVW